MTNLTEMCRPHAVQFAPIPAPITLWLLTTVFLLNKSVAFAGVFLGGTYE